MPNFHAYGMPGWHSTHETANGSKQAALAPAPVTAQVKPPLKPEEPEKKES